MKPHVAPAARAGAAPLAVMIAGPAALADATAGTPAPRSAQTASSASSVWDGVYTLAQAKRGALKSGLCTSCHGDGFVGGSAPELAGEAFLARWEGRSVADLFDLI